MIEKRKQPRYKVNVSIKYKRLDNPISLWQSGSQVKNISLGGLLFSAYEKIPVGTQLIFKMQIFVKNADVKIIELSANIVGVEDGMVSHDTRVAFTDLSSSQKSLLKQFISYVEP